MSKKNKIEKEIKENVISVDYNDEMQKSYIDYSLSVITDRALPDVRDGLKPVHRRILWSMKELGLKNNGPFKKSARIVGETMGKYHPHGDCLDGNTRVFMLNGTIKTMKELYDIGKPQWVLSIDEKANKIVPAVADDFRIGQYATQIYTIKFVNGYEISVTGNHPFRLQNGNWVKAEQIRKGMIFDFALTDKSRGNKDIVLLLNASRRKEEFIHNIVAKTNNYSSPIVTEIKITTLTDKIPMYDFTVDKYHNMFLCASDNANLLVVAHNSSIYEAMVHMGQNWCYNHPLVDGHGNFGSVEGDVQAASRYTEARLSKIAEDIYLSDMEKGVVDFRPNFDNSEQEPIILPVQIPNILISGTEGIAVGMASKMPTHNLNEVVNATIALLENPKLNSTDLMQYIKGPDFATYGIITNASELPAIYESGIGKIKIRGRVKVEDGERGKTNIVVTEIPYTMIGTIDKFMDSVADLVRNKTLPDVTDIKNFSGKDGIKIVIELRKGANVKRNINILYKKTKLEDTFGYNALLLAPNGTPKQMSLSDILQEFISFYKETTTKKYEYLLAKENKQKEIKEGLAHAVDCIDIIIEVLRGSKTVTNAKECLLFGKTDNIKFKTKSCETMAKKFSFTETQADAILDMKLQRLVGLEIDVLLEDLKKHIKNIKEYSELLNSNTKMKNKMKANLLSVKERYGKERKTEIIDAEEIVIEKEAVKEEPLYVLINKFGYVKAIDENTYERNKENVVNDYKYCVHTTNIDSIVIFTDDAKCHTIRVDNIPSGKYNDKGVAVETVSNIEIGANILYVSTTNDIKKESLLFVTEKAMVKTVEGSQFISSRKTIDATKIADGDKLFTVIKKENEKEIVMVSNNNNAIKFKLSEVVDVKKTSIGVRGFKLGEKEKIIYAGIGDDKTTFEINNSQYSFDMIKIRKRDGKPSLIK